MSDIITYVAILFIAVAVFWFLLLLTDAWRLRRLRKKYDESKDLSKQGEQARKSRGGISGIPAGTRFTEGELTPKGSDKPERREFLPTTAPKSIREDRSSFRASVSRQFSY